ncbi:MAG: FAD-dependent oxidoreductase, partial [Caulobacterales bacterium]|nr:FAD-dependent oxidoreductase [Caulobacterales bacterium]
VIVVGAGIVGVATAIWLQRDGHRVTLIDRVDPGDEAGASYGNGGVLASCSIVPLTVPGLMRKAPKMLFDRDEPLFLKWRYLPRLAPWLRRYLRHCKPEEARRIAAALYPIVGDSLADHQALAAGTGAEKWVIPSSFLFLYRDRRHFAEDAFAWTLRHAHGFRWDELEGAALQAYDPVYGDDMQFAADVPGHGRIADPGRYVRDLADHAAANGARIIKAEVEDIAHAEGRVTGVRAGGETIPCSAAVIAAGAHAHTLTAKLGLNVPLESERGYHIDLWGASRMPKAPTLVASGKFVATPLEGRLRLAGIVEFGGLDAPPSRAPFALLRRQIKSAMPGLKWEEAREWMGHRPTIVDSIPVIGEAPALKGAYLGFGHHHVGLTGGAKTGRLLAQLISGRAPNIDLAPYAPSRFRARGGG